MLTPGGQCQDGTEPEDTQLVSANSGGTGSKISLLNSSRALRARLSPESTLKPLKTEHMRQILWK